jgi:type IV pilus assembly protein PilN
MRPGDEEIHVMILINLLPHREEARKKRKEAFYATLVASMLLGVLIAGGVYGWYQGRLATQAAKNDTLKREIVKLDTEIKEIVTLEAEIAALRARQQAVEDLQSDRNLPVHLLNELVKQLPDGVFINKVAQLSPTQVEIGGVAQSQERIAELLRNLAYSSQWLSRPELGPIESQAAGTIANSAGVKDTRKLSRFTMKTTVRRPSDVASAAAAAASSAASAAKPASAPKS